MNTHFEAAGAGSGGVRMAGHSQRWAIEYECKQPRNDIAQNTQRNNHKDMKQTGADAPCRTDPPLYTVAAAAASSHSRTGGGTQPAQKMAVRR